MLHFYDPGDDDLNPIYNPITGDESPASDPDDLPYPDDLDPIYNPITSGDDPIYIPEND